MSEQLIQAVNKQVANWTVMYVKLHNYHWYVKGKDFFTLHEKFEELYNETATYIDDLAERLLALNGKPIATMKESLETASVKELLEMKQLNKWFKAYMMISQSSRKS